MTTAIAATVLAGAAICAALVALARRRPDIAVGALALLALIFEPWLLLPLAAAVLFMNGTYP